ncbi:molybdopterin molybdotransferase MoeA, partial [Desulfosarcina cetonica]|uniref:molybdopterin molybdotransferase MoeA n=1 Tax=Desulfosarcina cetonica TaxID=90730 RepID=UPI00155DB1A9
EVPVYRQPRVTILATGDELVVPGRPLPEGKLYASNLVMLNAWCRRYGMQTRFSILSDTPETIVQRLAEAAADSDAMITSGGAWTGERDFVAEALSALTWQRVFQWIRIGPGKAAGFGLLKGKPIFLLPGGPPSNLTAFLQIALPGLLRLGGHHQTALPQMKVRLDQSVSCRDVDWTEFVYGTFDDDDGQPVFRPLKGSSRLKSLALAQGVIAIPEGVKTLPAGSMIAAQMLF